MHHVEHLLESGEYGEVKEVFARLMLLSSAFSKTDISFQYDLGGGACLDLAYIFSACCYFGTTSHSLSKAHFTITSAIPRLHKIDDKIDEKIDEAVDCHFTISSPGKKPVNGHVQGDLDPTPFWGLTPKWLPEMPFVRIELERARVEFNNFVIPRFGHAVVVREKDGEGN